uniref:Origin recognition complex subunit 1 n=1 Tax=Acrobeloides nanus TaxID=290746 RepID=A0A914DQH0_9BILA
MSPGRRSERLSAQRSRSATRSALMVDKKAIDEWRMLSKRKSQVLLFSPPKQTPIEIQKTPKKTPLCKSVGRSKPDSKKAHQQVELVNLTKNDTTQKTPSKSRRDPINQEKLVETPGTTLAKNLNKLNLKSPKPLNLLNTQRNISKNFTPEKRYNTRRTPNKNVNKTMNFISLEEDKSDPIYINSDGDSMSYQETSSSSRSPTPFEEIPSTRRRSRARRQNFVQESDDSDKENLPLNRKEGRPSKGKTSKQFNKFKSLEQKLSPLEEIKKLLHTSFIPENLLRREKEYAEIKSFFESCLEKDAESQALYISGVPGTGKTATVLKVKNDLEQSNNFTFVHINGLEVTDPKAIFVSVYQQATYEYKKISANNARQKLNAMFNYADNRRSPIIMLVDEMDMLLTRRQEIIYDIFNWTALPEAKVNVIAISNTLDLPERMLNHRISSRLGSNRISFQPYEWPEITEIIDHRISKCKAISNDAIQFASRKVAALSGDLRKALDIMQRGVEIALDNEATEMTMEHVQKAIKEASCSIRMDFFRSISKHQLILVRAIVQDQLKSGLEESTFFQVFEEYKPMCLGDGIIPLSMSSAWCGIIFLCRCHLLILGSGVGDVDRKLKLGMSLQEAQFCLNMLKDDQWKEH